MISGKFTPEETNERMMKRVLKTYLSQIVEQYLKDSDKVVAKSAHKPNLKKTTKIPSAKKMSIYVHLQQLLDFINLRIN